MIELKNLHKSFGEKVIFKSLNYKIDTGSMVAIIGKSGCGKSTLLNMIGLLDSDYTGTILIDKNDIAKMNEKKKSVYIRNNINYLFQVFNNKNETRYDVFFIFNYMNRNFDNHGLIFI